MFQYTLDNKRYHTLNYYFKNRFGQKVTKVPLDINSPCPNKENGGCIYCANRSKSSIITSDEDIIKQFNNTKKILENKWPNSLYIPYFQTGTNTIIPVNKIKPLIDKLLELPKVVGIAIATRPDALSDEWLDYLDDLNKKTYLSIELGLQTCNEKTLKLINRGHGVDIFTEAVHKLHKIKVFVVAHIINGLPYETKTDMLNTIKYLNNLKIEGIKIHMLYIAKDTKLAEIYQTKPFPLLSKEEYVDIVCDQLTFLDEKVVIERITGDTLEDELIAPLWLIKKFQVLNDIDKEMVKRNIYQGQNVKR